MPEFIFHIQEFLFYTTVLFLVISVVNGLNGSSQVKVFEKKHMAILKFTRSLTYISFIYSLVVDFYELFQSSETNLQKIISIELFLLLLVAVLATIGIEKVKTNLTHGKKFKSSLVYFGIALVTMFFFLAYINFYTDAGFVF